MDMRLVQVSSSKDGVLGYLYRDAADDKSQFCATLEHAYDNGRGGWASKIPPGQYRCVRGQHCLEHGGPFETFEITGVIGHTDILFHAGNFNEDSKGCVLTGENPAPAMQDIRPHIINSRITFKSFMALQAGADEFCLTVINIEGDK